MFYCVASDAKLCDAVYSLNQQGYTVTKTKMLEGRVHEIYFRVRGSVVLKQ